MPWIPERRKRKKDMRSGKERRKTVGDRRKVHRIEKIFPAGMGRWGTIYHGGQYATPEQIEKWRSEGRNIQVVGDGKPDQKTGKILVYTTRASNGMDGFAQRRRVLSQRRSPEGGRRKTDKKKAKQK